MINFFLVYLGAQLGYFKGRGFVVEIGMKIFDFQLRHSGQLHDMCTFAYVFKGVKK